MSAACSATAPMPVRRTRFMPRGGPAWQSWPRVRTSRVKLGGMLNRGAALNFRELPAPPNSAIWAAAWRPYVEPCIELFGADRCNFESNFPVDKMGTGYATLWNAFKRITAGCSQIEKLALYSGTAK